jgi:hypothetical protein
MQLYWSFAAVPFAPYPVFADAVANLLGVFAPACVFAPVLGLCSCGRFYQFERREVASILSFTKASLAIRGLMSQSLALPNTSAISRIMNMTSPIKARSSRS